MSPGINVTSIHSFFSLQILNCQVLHTMYRLRNVSFYLYSLNDCKPGDFLAMSS